MIDLLVLTGFCFDVFIFNGSPPFNQEAMWIIITARHITQVAFGKQGAINDTGGTDDFLCGKTPEIIRI